MSGGAAPAVSVVVATYNRSRVLRHALASVVASTLDDWELVVVGDACTDDSEEVVRSFGDPRVRWENLPANCGDQSGPNNRGVALARGRSVAFLNHDDVYLPTHLEKAVAFLDATGADLAWVPALVADPPGEGAEAGGPGRFHLEGVPPASGWSPWAFYSASSWVFRRELAERVGEWPSPRECWVTPSQAWLFRAHRAGADLRFLPDAGVIVVWSGKRRGSYARAESPEHDALAMALAADPRFLERAFASAALSAASLQVEGVHHRAWKGLGRFLLQPVYSALSAAGVHPASLHMMLRHGGRGGFIRDHRRFTGIR